MAVVIDNIDNRYGAYVTTSTGANPAAGAEVSVTVPTGEIWRLLSVRLTLVTSATAATRRVILLADNGAATIWAAPAGNTQAASLTNNYSFTSGLSGNLSGTAEFAVGVGEDLWLPSGYRIRTNTENIQTGDDYAAPVLHIIRYAQ